MGAHKRGTSSLVRNVVQNKLRERRLMLGEEEGIQEVEEDSEYDLTPRSQQDLEMGNLND